MANVFFGNYGNPNPNGSLSGIKKRRVNSVSCVFSKQPRKFFVHGYRKTLKKGTKEKNHQKFQMKFVLHRPLSQGTQSTELPYMF
jgi:hypothetical protein